MARYCPYCGKIAIAEQFTDDVCKCSDIFTYSTSSSCGSAIAQYQPKALRWKYNRKEDYWSEYTWRYEFKILNKVLYIYEVGSVIWIARCLIPSCFGSILRKYL